MANSVEDLVANSVEDLVAYLLQQVLGPHHLLFEGVTEGGYQQ